MEYVLRVHLGFSEDEFLNCGHEKAKYFLRMWETEQNSDMDFQARLHGMKITRRHFAPFESGSDSDLSDEISKKEFEKNWNK